MVELHVVVRRQHLARRAAVHEHDRRPLLARLEILRQEELVVDLQTVGGACVITISGVTCALCGKSFMRGVGNTNLRRSRRRRARVRSTPAAAASKYSTPMLAAWQQRRRDFDAGAGLKTSGSTAQPIASSSPLPENSPCSKSVLKRGKSFRGTTARAFRTRLKS